MMRKYLLVAVMTPFLFAACDSPTGSSRQSVAVRFGVSPTSAAANLMASLQESAVTPSGSTSDLRVGSGTDTLVITSVRMTLADIDFEGRLGSPNIEGPVLVQLNFTGDMLTSPIEAQLPEGSYNQVSFDITVPDGGDPAEVAYLQQNPDMAGVTLRIAGTFNGEAFSFALALTGDQILNLSPPLAVVDGQSTLGIVIEFDVASWFIRGNGTLMNPNAICSVSSGCSDRTTVEQNIEQSIQSYSDV